MLAAQVRTRTGIYTSMRIRTCAGVCACACEHEHIYGAEGGHGRQRGGERERERERERAAQVILGLPTGPLILIATVGLVQFLWNVATIH